MSKEWDNSHDMRILDRIVRVHSTEQSLGIIVGGLLTPTSYQYIIRKGRYMLWIMA